MSIDANALCPCFSGIAYNLCCKPFHEGALPTTALQLMRSRYAAYALNKADYLIDTTHPENSKYHLDKTSWREKNSQFSLKSIFDGLEILEFKENGNHATVTFTAYITQNGLNATFTEKSFFEKVEGRWLYLNGVIN